MDPIKILDNFSSTLPPSCGKGFEDWKAFFNHDKVAVETWKDYQYLPLMSAQTVEWMYENFQPNPSDILAVSAPKTGTTWLREILRQILYGRDADLEKMSRALDFYLCYFEFGKKSKFDIWDAMNLPRRYFQTHLPPDAINVKKFEKCKMIYCTRNFKDQLVSFYHFNRNFPWIKAGALHDKYSPEWDAFLEQHMNGIQPVGLKQGETFLDYHKQWEPYLKSDNILTISYEDMKQNLPREIRRIAAHIEIDISMEEVERIAEVCGLENMKARTFGPLIRKGIVGDWKNHFTVAQSEKVDKVMREKGMNLIN